MTQHPRDNTPPASEIWYGGVTQDSQAEWYYLKGSAFVRTSEMVVTADEIDFNSDTQWAYARGHVRLEQFASGDIINAERGEYNLRTEEGKFYVVEGTSPTKIMASKFVLTTTNPFFYQGAWVERIKSRIILHKGFVTDCKMPNPLWKFEAPLFDIVPGQRAIARNSLFRLHNIPIFYLPYFRRPLGKSARQSGFLAPTAGHSNVYGFIYGGGYYWAINRSYDLTYDLQYYTSRGPAHTIEFRGKPNAPSSLDLNFYGVQDKGYHNSAGTLVKQGGYEIDGTGRTQLLGFTGFLNLHYVSSYAFRIAFGNNFSALVQSSGYLQRHFDNDLYSFDIAFSRDQTYEDVDPNHQVVIQKLPVAEVSGRSRQIIHDVPLWFSFTGASGEMNRSEPSPGLNVTTQRSDLRPTVSSAFGFKGFSLYPSVSFEGTDYGNRYLSNTASAGVAGAQNLFRDDVDFVLDFRAPALERTFMPPKWLHLGEKLRHVVETEAQYEYLTGVRQFNRIIKFDGTDIVANTNQLTIGVTNRLYKKEKSGNVTELLSWRLRYAKYFDPTFGGAVVPGQANVILAQELLTPYTFLTGPRSYSPVVSTLTLNPWKILQFDYAAAYDPRAKKFIDNTIGAGFGYQKYFIGVGDTSITPSPGLGSYFSGAVNQMVMRAGYGNTNRRGFNAAAQAFYDVQKDKLTFSLYQASYNTDCCGFSVQLRRVNFSFRDENEYLFSFSLANIGQFGSLQKQQRIF